MPRSTRAARQAFTLVELVVTIAILAALIALLLPAVQQARESARRTACQANLRQMGTALLNQHDATGAFPAGWRGYEGNRSEVSQCPGWSWAAAALPYLEQKPLSDQLEFSRSILDSRNDLARQTALRLYRCPSDGGPAFFDLKASGNVLGRFPAANYVANFGAHPPQSCVALAGLGTQCTGDPQGGVFFHNSQVRIAEIGDGTSQTILVGERKSEIDLNQSPVATWVGALWEADGSFARVLGSAYHTLIASRRTNLLTVRFADFSSEHPGGQYFVFADGHVAFVADNIDHLAFVDLATRDQTYANLPPTTAGGSVASLPPADATASDATSSAADPSASSPATPSSPAAGSSTPAAPTPVYPGASSCPCCSRPDYSRPVYVYP